MRYLILTDIHSNSEALAAVLDRASGAYDQVLCCGDIVGYGADPNPAADWVRTHCKTVIRGNHDKACAGGEDLEWFNALARASALWTQAVLTPENAAWLASLPRGPAMIGDFQILHGSPLDEDEYLVTQTDASQLLGYLETRVSFIGHTHLQGGFSLHRGGVRRIPPVPPAAELKELDLEPDAYYLINPGSVGQPRDGDPRAAFVIYTPGQRRVAYHRVPYDIDGAQRKIRDAGLPDLLALRLATGQ